MKLHFTVIRVFTYFLVSIIFSTGLASAQETVTGMVFHDLNQNGQHDTGEPGLPDVLVSNGTDIVTTDEDGRYEITANDNSILFIIKPRDWTTESDENNIPGFYTILSSDGAGGTDYPGLEPTGLRLESVDFAWWTGAHDEYGIPHSMMQDGSPTGYAFLDINGNDWKLLFKAARRPADFQMHIFTPDEITLAAIDTVEVFANVFNALPAANVEMRVGKSGNWQAMTPTERRDPVYEAMREREHALDEISWRRAGDANPTPRHLWQGVFPDGLEPGTYTIYVRSEDEWDTYEGRRIIRIVE